MQDDFRKVLSEELATFFGQVIRYVDERFDEVKDDLGTIHDRLDRQQTTLDGIAKRLDDDDTERAAMTHQLDGHETRLTKLEGRPAA